MFLGDIKMFSVHIIQKLYCHANKLVHCQYISCNNVGFSQKAKKAGALRDEVFLDLSPYRHDNIQHSPQLKQTLVGTTINRAHLHRSYAFRWLQHIGRIGLLFMGSTCKDFLCRHDIDHCLKVGKTNVRWSNTDWCLACSTFPHRIKPIQASKP